MKTIMAAAVFFFLTGASVSAGTEAKIISVSENLSEVPKFEKLELTVAIEAPYTNPFDPEEVDLAAEFTDPSGKTSVMPGFYSGPDWKVRFSPDLEGEWKYVVCLKTKEGAGRTEQKSFKCAASQAKGFIRVSKADPKYFEFTDGSFYYPVGENICWASLPGFRKYFAEMQKAGGNWTRIWMSNWEAGLEWTKGSGYRGLGKYNLEKADKLDKIVDLAKEYGLYFQLVINHHGQLSTKVNPQWDDNPYNAKNGGPCKSPQDFFTDPEAKKHFKNRMRYIIARWGYSPNIMAWELWNELTFVDDLDLGTDAAWHKEMASYIKGIDPHRHLITTSYAGTFHGYGFNGKVWEIPEIDFTQFHMYTQDVVSAVIGAYRLMDRFDKPYFMGEIGTDSSDGVDKKDADGAYLHSALWAEYMLACGGNAMPWWWDSYIHPKNMYYHWAALSEFNRGVDRRGKGYRTSTARVLAEVDGLRSPLFAMGLMSNKEGFVWVFDPKWTKYEAGRPEPPFIKDAAIRINWVDRGKYSVEFWDTWKGTVVERQEIASDDNGLDIVLPAFKRDMAVKIIQSEMKAASGKKAALADTVPAAIGFTRKEIVLKKAKQHIKVDGDLSEWYISDFSGSQTASVDKGSAKFYMLYDKENLYLAAAVDDDIVMGDQSGVDIWRDDGVELWIDAKGDADVFNNMPFNPGCYQINIAPLTKDGKAGVYVYRNINTRPLADAIRAASKVSSDPKRSGYSVEAAIPISAVNGLELREGKVLGVNFSITDKDSAKGEWRHIMWSGKQEDDATQWGRLKVK
ncbi:MAG: sugar-binding protein [Candidatus Omnitrophica bacterium]|nr:sugar-binding protein [Candidatus Omnitrophota bacterium]